jgi:hypothetical protein
MKGRWALVCALVAAAVVVAAANLALAEEPQPQTQGEVVAQAMLGSAFTYQGQLKKDGNPVTATCDFRFSLWDALSGGSQVGTTQEKAGVSVSGGFFTIADLDFGTTAFEGNERFLEIAVKCAGDADYIALSPCNDSFYRGQQFCPRCAGGLQQQAPSAIARGGRASASALPRAAASGA